MKSTYLFILLLIGYPVFSQRCPDPGQNPSTAFPVCGTNVFGQSTVPLCAGTILPSPHCSGEKVADVNPYWYKFTCFSAGALGFLITPNDLKDDYDWELYDITGRNPNDIYTDGSMVVASNWSGESGLTGASAAGTNLYVCSGPGKALFSSMPHLILRHDYLLLISHFTNTQSGYNLEFKGGTAGTNSLATITDPAPPALKKVSANCGADKIRVSLSKKMKCSSIATNGSDFMISPAGYTILSAKGIGCSSAFDTDSLELTLASPLPVGNYSVIIKKGSDGNTIIDNCDDSIPVNNALPLVIEPQMPTPMDSMAPLQCAPSQIRLIFKKPMLCSSIAANGSDFMINGTYPVTVSSASGHCVDGLSSEILLQLDKPLQQDGSFTLVLGKGSDGNTLIDECNQETPAGSSLNFAVKDTVNAGFRYDIYYGCKMDTVDYIYDARNGVNSWQWSLDDNFRMNTQNPEVKYNVFDTKNVQLIVSNGFCSDTSSGKIVLDNYLKADFTVEEDNCPLEPVTFTNISEGSIATHNWVFQDGSTSSDKSPDHTYDRPLKVKTYNVSYTATDLWGCTSTREKAIKVYSSCIIDVPNGFTPNGDNINDVFYPLNAVKAMELDFKVYNRWGQLLYNTDNWKKGWDGKYKDVLQPSGMYVWSLRYIDRDSKKQIRRKGSVFLSN